MDRKIQDIPVLSIDTSAELSGVGEELAVRQKKKRMGVRLGFGKRMVLLSMCDAAAGWTLGETIVISEMLH